MDASESKTEQDIAGTFSRPVRVLVQTSTHLVPGDGYFRKCEFMQNKLCQLHWNCDFDYKQHRWSTYGCEFALDNRPCYALIDSGKVAGDDDDDKVPILPYEWTGEIFKPKPQLSESPRVRHILKKHFPFSRKPRKDTPQAERSKRELIRSNLYKEIPLSDRLLKEIRDHSDDAKWLQRHREPRFWLKVED
ncbi:conserved hypothetical protein [Microsporum canis CBS 113480]|uniref:Uncharacterized protein n=1 Tax=Arthroderma otae (strain ATCC MYA-4605 / CBS 113480) TaxID=554155 RepID=C5FR15_ARTOC|nr:conserved hypothetical protein [Microsporum canis CBS 113480]EEQ32318.1 conserved hypothetical protein [Microsporum canis CBS 113480]